jgi:predicted house-cleaning noncanonical NTP pyrophosphatase (MazG superfamily)
MAEEYDKLVRDHVPEVIEADGSVPVVHTVEGEAYSRRLDEKLDEEVAELHDRRAVEELADVLEVIHAIRADLGVSPEELEAVRAAKADERGRFEQGVVLDRVEDGTDG